MAALIFASLPGCDESAEKKNVKKEQVKKEEDTSKEPDQVEGAKFDAKPKPAWETFEQRIASYKAATTDPVE